VEPEKSLLQFFASCIFSHSCPQTCTIIRLFWAGLILHLILHFSQKVAIFAPKRVILLLFVPTLFFAALSVHSPQASSKISGQTSLHQPWLSPYCLFKD